MASFFVQQLDLLSLTSPPTFDRRGQSAPSAKQFSPRAFSLAGATDDEGAGGREGRADSQSSLHRLHNEGSLRGERELNCRVGREGVYDEAVLRFCYRRRRCEFVEAKTVKTY